MNLMPQLGQSYQRQIRIMLIGVPEHSQAHEVWRLPLICDILMDERAQKAGLFVRTCVINCGSEDGSVPPDPAPIIQPQQHMGQNLIEIHQAQSKSTQNKTLYLCPNMSNTLGLLRARARLPDVRVFDPYDIALGQAVLSLETRRRITLADLVYWLAGGLSLFFDNQEAWESLQEQKQNGIIAHIPQPALEQLGGLVDRYALPAQYA